MGQCRLTTKAGNRCKNTCTEGSELCPVHERLLKQAQNINLEKATKYVAIASGAITIIKTAIEVWKSLSFGTHEDKDFTILERKYSAPSWNTPKNIYTPFNKRCDWISIRELAPKLENLENTQINIDDCPLPLIQFGEWYGNLQPEFKREIESKLE